MSKSFDKSLRQIEESRLLVAKVKTTQNMSQMNVFIHQKIEGNVGSTIIIVCNDQMFQSIYYHKMEQKLAQNVDNACFPPPLCLDTANFHHERKFSRLHMSALINEIHRMWLENELQAI